MKISLLLRCVLYRMLAMLAILSVLGWMPKESFAQSSAGHSAAGPSNGLVRALPWPLFQPALLLAQTASTPGTRPRKNPKLTTTVADLARATTQRRGPVAKGQRIAPPPGFSIAALPKSVRDAVQTRRMRISKDAEVQVYIEVSEVTDQNLNALRGLGVTVQIVGTPKPDKSRKEVLSRVPTVQGLLPVSMIDPVSALPFVRFVRLPDYGIRQTGSVDSEGDATLKADQVRSALGVDGTGVRVGVISDGINGIFAAGCTTCGPTTATPSPISSGDLPDASGTRNASGVLTSVSGGITAQSFRSDGDLEGPLQPGCVQPGAGAEGTALLEIVHDLAPGARLFLRTWTQVWGFNRPSTGWTRIQTWESMTLGFSLRLTTAPARCHKTPRINSTAMRIRFVPISPRWVTRLDSTTPASTWTPAPMELSTEAIPVTCIYSSLRRPPRTSWAWVRRSRTS